MLVSSRFQAIRPCRNQDRCEINVITRKLCPHCRLEKCRAMGMSNELIRKVYQRSKPSHQTNQARAVSGLFDESDQRCFSMSLVDPAELVTNGSIIIDCIGMDISIECHPCI